jgi:hypothetical protein
MDNHWQEAQEQERSKGPGNFVFSPEENACIAGNEDLGWMILTSEGSVKVRIAQGVDMMLEELGLPYLGWH